MNPKQNSEESCLHLGKESSKCRPKCKDLHANSREFQTLCLNQSEMKHMNAIRPYCAKERKSTRRESRHNQSPYEMSRSNSRRLENSNRKSEDGKIKRCSENGVGPGGKQMSNMLSELINLKSEYKILKANYTKILAEKQDDLIQQQKDKKRLMDDLEKSSKEVERYQKSTVMFEQEVDRIKKECSRIIEMERFKIRKLEETLQEKDLMIAFLRNEIENLRKGNAEPGQPLFFLQNSAAMLNYSYYNKQAVNLSAMSNIMPAEPSRQFGSQPQVEEDSLCLSRDRSKEMDSIIHSFLSNNDHSIHQPNFTKKDTILINSLQESPIEPQIEIIEEKSEVSEKESIEVRRAVKEQRGEYPQIKETISMKVKTKTNAKKLQIMITDENSDTQNVTQNLKEELSMQTRKKMASNSSVLMCKQKKKLTAKKIKPF